MVALEQKTSFAFAELNMDEKIPLLGISGGGASMSSVGRSMKSDRDNDYEQPSSIRKTSLIESQFLSSSCKRMMQSKDAIKRCTTLNLWCAGSPTRSKVHQIRKHIIKSAYLFR